MEEMLELVVAIIAVVVGIATKASKKKKAQQKSKSASAWDEMGKGIEERFEALINRTDGEPIIPYAPSEPESDNAPVQPVAPAQPTVAPAQPAVAPVQPAAAPAAPVPQIIIAQSVPELHMEGAPAEPVAPPVPKPRPRPKKPEEPMQTAHHAPRSRLLPGRITAGSLRSAVVMSEVLGRPVSLKNTARR